MNSCRFFLTVCFFVLTQTIVLGQLDTNFTKHLIENKLQREHLSYLSKISIREDSLALELAKYYLFYGEDSLFFTQIERAKNCIQSNPSFLAFANTYFFNASLPTQKKWFDWVNSESSALVQQQRFIYFSSIEPKSVNSEDLPEELSEVFQRYKKVNRKNPYVAAGFSALLPGLGKLYIGNYRSAGITLFSLGILGAQTAESFRSLGIKHPITLLNLGFFTGYYLANVVGSYRDTKTKKREHKIEYLRNAANYYQYSVRPTLF